MPVDTRGKGAAVVSISSEGVLFVYVWRRQ